MTVISVASVKGAPGVTTLTYVMAAAWTGQRKVIVVEADPSGGDLAARFHLSTRVGWPSFMAAARRGTSELAIEPHLQQLPGNLDVLVGTVGAWASGLETVAPVERFLSCVRSSHHESRDVFVDLGRVLPWESASMAWIEASDRVVLCTCADVASVIQVREKSAALLERSRGAVGLAVIGKGDYSRDEIGEFTGIPVIGECSLDPVVAAMTCREERSTRRWRRSSLLACATELVSVLVDDGSSADRPDSLPTGLNLLFSRKAIRKMMATSGTSTSEIDQHGALG